MTATEWLIEQIIKYELVDKTINPDNVLFNKAKVMEKEQLEKAIEFGNKRMYSEEDMIDFGLWLYLEVGSSKAKERTNKELFNKWLEKYKNK